MLLRCPACGHDESEPVLALGELPVLLNAQVTPTDAPNVAKGPIDLVCCTGCTHLYNASFNEDLVDYDAAYENTLHYSAHFQKFAHGLAERLVSDHNLSGGAVVDIGCGPGHFLTMLCEAGVGSGRGYDPSYSAERMGAPTHPAVELSTEIYPDDGSVPVDLAMSQHVLEHLEDPIPALRALRSGVVERKGTVYSEVPNGQLMIDKVALWDLIYEHLSYFTPMSLQVALARAGLSITTIDTAYDGQFLWAEAKPSDESSGQAPLVAVAPGVEAAQAFGDAARQRITQARDELAAYAEQGPVVVWGAGSKGMTYLNLMPAEHVAGVVDVNPRKFGAGVPGTSLVISSPESVSDIGPATILIANPIYANEIGEQVSSMGVDASIVPLWS